MLVFLFSLFFFICVKGLTKELQKKAFPFPSEPPPPAVSWATEPQAMPKNCTPNHKEESLSLFALFQAVLKKHRPFWMFPQICTRQMQATRCLAGEEAHRLYFIRFRGSETKFEAYSVFTLFGWWGIGSLQYFFLCFYFQIRRRFQECLHEFVVGTSSLFSLADKRLSLQVALGN